MTTENNRDIMELRAEVEERTHEIKQYVRAYGPRILLVGGIAISSCLLLGYLIRKAV